MSDLEAIRSELARIRALEKKATKGPWVARKAWVFSGAAMVAFATELLKRGNTKAEEEANAALMAAARTDVPRLVKALERAVEALRPWPHHKEALADIARLLKEE